VRTTLTSRDDCAEIGNGFLILWCQRTLSFSSGSLPGGSLRAQDNIVFYASLAASLIRGDRSICDEPSVARWVTVSSQVDDGSAACRVAFDRYV